MNKKGLVVFIGTAFFASLFLVPTFDKAHSAEKVINLKIASFYPAVSAQSKITEEFGQELQARSGGRIKVQYFPGGSLLTAPAMFKGIETGIADIGYAHIFYTTGRMPVCESLGLPLGVPSGWVSGHYAYDFYQRFKPKEWDSVKLLAIHGNAPNLLISKKAAEKLEDLKGLTIRATGVVGDTYKALGGNPAPTPMMEVYDAISKGVVDGVFAPYEALKTFRFAEVAKYVITCWQVGPVSPFYLAMNKNSYNNLPRDLQSLVDMMGGEYQERLTLVWNAIELEGKAFAAANGVRLVELSDQEGARWQKAVEPVVGNYVKTMVGKGFPEAEVRGWIEFSKERIKYWTEKQMEYKIPSPTGPAGMRPEAYVK